MYDKTSVRPNFEAYKKRFKEYFIKNIEDHLSSPLDKSEGASKTQPYNVIHNATQIAPGEFTRILDQFKIPVPEYEDFKEYVEPPHCIGEYLQSLITEILPFILNNEKNALNPALIKAINTNNDTNYAKMLKIAQNNPETIAKMFVQAILVGYGQQMLDNLKDEEKAPWFNNEAAEFTFLGKYLSFDGLSKSVLEPITIDGLETSLNIFKQISLTSNIKDLISAAESSLDMSREGGIGGAKALEKYFLVTDKVLLDDSFNKLSPDQLTLLETQFKEDSFIVKYRPDLNLKLQEKIQNYLESIKKQVEDKKFNKLTYEEHHEKHHEALQILYKLFSENAVLVNHGQDLKIQMDKKIEHYLKGYLESIAHELDDEKFKELSYEAHHKEHHEALQSLYKLFYEDIFLVEHGQDLKIQMDNQIKHYLNEYLESIADTLKDEKFKELSYEQLQSLHKQFDEDIFLAQHGQALKKTLVEKYLQPIKHQLEDKNFKQLTPEEQQSLYKQFDEDIFLVKHGQELKKKFVEKYLQPIKHQLEDKNFKQLTPEELTSLEEKFKTDAVLINYGQNLNLKLQEKIQNYLKLIKEQVEDKKFNKLTYEEHHEKHHEALQILYKQFYENAVLINHGAVLKKQMDEKIKHYLKGYLESIAHELDDEKFKELSYEAHHKEHHEALQSLYKQFDEDIFLVKHGQVLKIQMDNQIKHYLNEYLESIADTLKDENFTKLSYEELQSLYKQFDKDIFLVQHGQALKKTLVEKYLGRIEHQLKDENFKKLSSNDQQSLYKQFDKNILVKHGQDLKQKIIEHQTQHIESIKLQLEDENFNKLNHEELQSLYMQFYEDDVLVNHGQKLKNTDNYLYLRAYNLLSQTKSTDEEVNRAVQNLLNTVQKLKKDGHISQSDLPNITKYLKDTATLIKNPDKEQCIQQHNENITNALGKNRPWGPIIGGALLCLAGILLVAAAIAITVLTFGGSSPLTFPAMVVGGAMSATGIAITAGVAVGLAATGVIGFAVASKAGMFANRAAKGPIANALIEVSSSLEKNNNMKSALNDGKIDKEEIQELNSGISNPNK